MQTVMVTGGAGFIGSALIRHLIAHDTCRIINVDCLTYAGHTATLQDIDQDPRYRLEQVDIRDRPALDRLFSTWQPDIVVHLAAESHVDRSIDGPAVFIDTNIVGVFNLLEAARSWYEGLEGERRERFRFHHVSTDEVFGDLAADAAPFSETSPYAPSSPYAASKASADHLVRAWQRTYGLPTLITNCSNNYGPWHFPEKLIPLVILNAIQGRAIPVYGEGHQIRDWLFVEDHARALHRVMHQGVIGSSYNIGGHEERRNIDVVTTICDVLERLEVPHPEGVSRFHDLITYVADRPGHDRRYAIDASHIERELGWRPQESFESGIEKTVRWFLSHGDWCQGVEKADTRQRQGLGATV